MQSSEVLLYIISGSDSSGAGVLPGPIPELGPRTISLSRDWKERTTLLADLC
jgi:hypothetical protein